LLIRKRTLGVDVALQAAPDDFSELALSKMHDNVGRSEL
jgi:hypothetical protein